MDFNYSNQRNLTETFLGEKIDLEPSAIQVRGQIKNSVRSETRVTGSVRP